MDWRALGLYDYPQVVKQPMDLGTIQKRLASTLSQISNNSNTNTSTSSVPGYNSVQECANDVRLIWKNCMTYNADGSEFYLLAEGFSKRFEEKYDKLLVQPYGDAALNASMLSVSNATISSSSKQGSSNSRSNEPTNSERIAFAKSLYKISKEELGKVINDLDEKCPEALTKNASEDEVEINVDAISAMAFAEVNLFVRKCAGDHNQAGSSSKKKKASSSGSATVPAESLKNSGGGAGRNKKSKTSASN